MKSHLTIKQRVIISITPCNRPNCQHAVCRAHRAWIQWREEQLAQELQSQCMQPHEVKEFLTSINI